MPVCGKGPTIRTAKGGQYSDCTCAAKVVGTAARCSRKSIREEALEEIVLDALVQRLLEPERLEQLLAHFLEASDTADERQARDLQQARAESTRVETGIDKLLDLVETGLTSGWNFVFAKRLSDHRARRDTKHDYREPRTPAAARVASHHLRNRSAVR